MAAASFVRHGKKVSRSVHGTTPYYIMEDKIIAVGRNYAEHIKELQNVTPKEPFFFLKPTTSYLRSGGKLEIPLGIQAHHEGIYKTWKLLLAIH
jgi:2-keto-4-pentenoate hydratase/2-oxohepta-3-ene-1,7-dioic acid hydratase in catechol pathway